MLLTSFEAENYRNVSYTKLSFSPGVNLLFGENAQGKTNLIEGIYTFARGKSFRGASDADQVAFGQAGFSLSLGYKTEDRDNLLTYRYYNGERRRYVNGAPAPLSEMIGRFRAVLFYPDHLDLVKGGPTERRLFLNIAISQIDKIYLKSLTRYEKLLKNRNAVLKEAGKNGYLDRDLLASYSEGMAEECATVALARQAYIEKAEGYASPLLRELSGAREQMRLFYRADSEKRDRESIKNEYIEKYSTSLDREIAAGCSLFGIHRDDMEIEVNNKPARVFCSQGQQRSAVLCLKMAEGEVSYAETGEYPVFLFDDVLSELDEGRRSFLLSGAGQRQIVITSCERGALGGIAANEIYVEGGRYDPAHR